MQGHNEIHPSYRVVLGGITHNEQPELPLEELDVTRSAIPPLSSTERDIFIEDAIKMQQEIDRTENNIDIRRLELDILTKSGLYPNSTLSLQEKIAFRMSFEQEVKQMLTTSVQIPKHSGEVFTDLNLTLDPIQTSYALFYIVTVGTIKDIQNSVGSTRTSRNQRTAQIKETFDRTEESYERMSFMHLSTRERMQIRTAIEEGYQRRADVSFSDSNLVEEQALVNEFQIDFTSIEKAILQMKDDILKPATLAIARNHLQERVFESSPWFDTTEDFFAAVCQDLDRKNAPEMIAIYKAVTGDDLLPDNMETFLAVLKPGLIPQEIYETTRISPDDIKIFRDFFEEANPQKQLENTQANKIKYICMQVINIFQQGTGMDFTDEGKYLPSLVDAFQSGLNIDRGEFMAMGVYGALLTYVDADVLKKFVQNGRSFYFT